jgi:hypothetical protein
MSVLESAPDKLWAPTEIGTADTSLKLPSIRSNLKRMARDGKVEREGERYRVRVAQGLPFQMRRPEPADAA